ncbi:hypothetical protein BS47DRAFT_1345738 [Hydnum rufescens UP504]|uniref:DUF6534 domain-containing protein n=1 Tax=Hydnum rufescens UP504 TaxID=1448309 RepID=A0A9P6AUL4_9AGAM|nr:hypothetical protein BS47DRAFT_1345738 [Hydnum rufescens UP504]
MELEAKYALESTSGALRNYTLGAVLVSIVVSASLFGILTTQCHYYALRFKQDPRWLKCIVAALWIIDGTHQIIVSAIIIDYSVYHYGDFEYLLRGIWPISFSIMLEPLPALIVQLYFTYRFHHLSRKLRPVAAFTAILSIVAFAMGEACGIITYAFPRYAGKAQSFTWLVATWLVIDCICVIVVTIAMARTLYTSRTAFKPTNVLLVKLMLWTVNTGALLTAFAVLEVLTFLLRKDSFIHLGANIVIAKIYSNTLLASLNQRGTLTKGGADALHLSDNLAVSPVGSRRNRARESSGPHPLPSLKKNRRVKNQETR